MRAHLERKSGGHVCVSVTEERLGRRVGVGVESAG
jgi:hypothetical protein